MNIRYESRIGGRMDEEDTLKTLTLFSGPLRVLDFFYRLTSFFPLFPPLFIFIINLKYSVLRYSPFTVLTLLSHPSPLLPLLSDDGECAVQILLNKDQ